MESKEVTENKKTGQKIQNGSKKKVLIVDDIELFVQLEKSFLTRKDTLEVFTAYDGYQALEIVQAQMPDIVYMDLFMPKLNGDDCCRIIKNDPKLKHIPVIMVTHGGRQESLEQCLNAGCDEILTKPINRSLFNAFAKKYLNVQTRIEPRYSARLKVRFGTEMENVLSDYTVNLSTGGLFLATSSILPLNTDLNIEFNLPDNENIISCKARVAWINDPETLFKPDLPQGMGLQFTNITLDDMDAIRGFISRQALTADWEDENQPS